jgi:hypothetical protein
MSISGFSLMSPGTTEFATTLAPIGTKKEKKIQMAKVARAEVAIPRNRMENRILIPSQKAM